MKCSLQDIVVYDDVQESYAVEISNTVEWRHSNGEEQQQEYSLHSEYVDTRVRPVKVRKRINSVQDNYSIHNKGAIIVNESLYRP